MADSRAGGTMVGWAWKIVRVKTLPNDKGNVFKNFLKNYRRTGHGPCPAGRNHGWPGLENRPCKNMIKRLQKSFWKLFKKLP
jgi:hypothetical protein